MAAVGNQLPEQLTQAKGIIDNTSSLPDCQERVAEPTSFRICCLLQSIIHLADESVCPSAMLIVNHSNVIGMR